MDNSKLYEWVSAYVDGELSASEEASLLEEAEKDPAIRQAIEQEKILKKLLKTRLQRASAPESLHRKIKVLLSQEKTVQPRAAENYKALNMQQDDQPSASRNKFLLALAAVLLSALLLVLARQGVFTTGTEAEAVTVEQLTSVHYINQQGGRVVDPVQLSVAEAQQYFKNTYGCDITVPELAGARFAGAVYTNFFGEFHTPLLQYEVEEGDYIYIFAFEKDELRKQKKLIADQNATGAITKHDDVFIMQIEGLDVVSWKWHNVWYTAVSAHQGDVVAAMLPH